MNVLITNNKKNGTIEVNVSVDPIGPKGKEVYVNTKIVKEHLTEKGIIFGECSQSSIVTNTSERLLGTWIFIDPTVNFQKQKSTLTDVPKKKVKSKNTDNKLNFSDSTLDKKEETSFDVSKDWYSNPIT